jgi:hypothetical protein
MMDHHFSFPDQPTLKRQPFVYSPKDDLETMSEVSRPEGGKFGEISLKFVKSEKVTEEAQEAKENEIKQNLGIPPDPSTQVHQIVSVPLEELPSIREGKSGEEQERAGGVTEGQEQTFKGPDLVEHDVLAAQPSEDSLADKIFYSEERVTIPYDPLFFPGIDYPNDEVSIPQEGHFIAGINTLNDFSEQVLDNMVHLIKRENQNNNPYEQLKRDIGRARFYLEEKGEKRPLLANGSSAALAGEASQVEGKEQDLSRPSFNPKQQAIFNLEVFVGNKLLARAIGSTLHQTLFTFLPDLATNQEIVGLPRPSSESAEGAQATPEYTLEKKQETESSKPFFIITATSSADVAGFTFKDQSNGQIATFLFGDLPPGRSLNFKQTASIAITLEINPDDQFDPKQSWSKENFPCSVKCIGYINIYISHLVQNRAEESSSSKKLLDASSAFVSHVSEKLSSFSSVSSAATERAAKNLQSVNEQAGASAVRIRANLNGVRGVMTRGVGDVWSRGKQAVQSLQQKKSEES